jgi:hypothetical protein
MGALALVGVHIYWRLILNISDRALTSRCTMMALSVLKVRWNVRLAPSDAHATMSLSWAIGTPHDGPLSSLNVGEKGGIIQKGGVPSITTTTTTTVKPSFLIMVQMSSEGVVSLGSVLGSPFVIKKPRLYFSSAHPLGASGTMSMDPTTAVCGSAYLRKIVPGEGLAHALSVIVGGYVAPVTVICSTMLYSVPLCCVHSLGVYLQRLMRAARTGSLHSLPLTPDDLSNAHDTIH